MMGRSVGNIDTPIMGDGLLAAVSLPLYMIRAKHGVFSIPLEAMLFILIKRGHTVKITNDNKKVIDIVLVE
jgi:hypothetical protein